MSSAIAQYPAAQSGLQALVQGALASVFTDDWTADEVVVGYPSGGPHRPVAVWIGGHISDRKDTDETTGDGERAGDDSFTLTVYLVVVRAVADYAEIRDEILGYMALIEDAVPANRKLGGAVADSTVAGGDIHEFLEANDVGRGMEAQILIRCLILT